MDEELKKQEAERLKMTGAVTEQSASNPIDSQAQDLDNLEAAAGSTIGQAMVPTLRLIPFEQKKVEEVPYFNTIFYDRERKRIVKRTERKVETWGHSGKMINDTTIVYETDEYPIFTIKVRAALIMLLSTM